MKAFCFAGETSGDLLGSDLLRKLSSFSWSGVGGERMQAAGLKPLLPFSTFHVMGFTDVLGSLPTLLRSLRQLTNRILSENPPLVLLIDSPDFTMRLGKQLRKRGYRGKIVHYVSPSVWAWRRSRASKLAEHTDLLLCLLPFEPAYYQSFSMQTLFVGHPLAHKLAHTPSIERSSLALFPGSRRSEIKANLPLQLSVASEFALPLKVSVASPTFEPLIDEILGSTRATKIEGSNRYSLMQEAKLAIATSGTVNLELALLGTPTLVTYKIPMVNYLLARYLFQINLPFYSLPNIILNEPLFPEFYGRTLSKKPIVDYGKRLLQNSDSIAKGREALFQQLGDLDPSEKAANAIHTLLETPS